MTVPLRGERGREGSQLIHEAADEADLTNHLEVIEGAGHVFLNDCARCLPIIRQFLATHLGGTPDQPDCGEPADSPALDLTAAALPDSLDGLSGATFYEDVPYADGPRNVLDVIVPDADEPTPLLIYIHGGGFKGGDKRQWYENNVRVRRFHEAGVAMATINYHLLAQDGTETDGLIRSMRDSRRALQFLRYHAADFHIDPNRIGLVGGSAGAGTALWIGLGDEACDPNAGDPVDRVSTRARAITAIATQATYDVVRWETDVFDEEFPKVTLENVINFEPAFLDEMAILYGQPPNWTDLSPLEQEPVLSYRRRVDMLDLPDPDDPPLYLWNGGDPSRPTTRGALLHHPLHAIAMYDAAVAAGMTPVELQTPDRNEGPTDDWMQFMLDKL